RAHRRGGSARLLPQRLRDGERQGGGPVEDDVGEPGLKRDRAVGVDRVPDARTLRVDVSEGGGDRHLERPRPAVGVWRPFTLPSPRRGEGFGSRGAITRNTE